MSDGLYVIRLIAFVGIASGPHDAVPVGSLVMHYDPDAHDGQGHVAWTTVPDDAMQFASITAAMNCWRAQSVVRPFRDDGHPNRPLTAATCEFVKVSEL